MGQVFRSGAKRLTVTTKRPKIPRPGIMAAPPTHGLTPLRNPTGGNNNTNPSKIPRLTLDHALAAKVRHQSAAHGIERRRVVPAQMAMPALDQPVASLKNLEVPCTRPKLAAP
jgi:hypothetical protein